MPHATTDKISTDISDNDRMLTMADAMMEAIAIALESDDSTFVMGEDIGVMGGVAGQTRGLFERFGPDRLIDTPISEAAFTGLAAGAAQMGFRPIVELMRVDFFGVAMDQIYNYLAKIRYATNGARAVPVTIMTSIGNPLKQGAVHAQTLYGLFAHVPGLKLVAPSTPADAKGLLLAAIRDDSPVMFFFHAGLLALPYMPGTEEYTGRTVPAGAYELPIGEARVVRPGSDVTIVSLSYMVHESLRAANVLAGQGVDAEVIDLRSVVPLDGDAVLGSVARTGRLVVVDEDYAEFGLAAELIARVAESGLALAAPPRRVARAQVPVPYSLPLEQAVVPGVDRIVEAARALLPGSPRDRPRG